MFTHLLTRLTILLYINRRSSFVNPKESAVTATETQQIKETIIKLIRPYPK